MTTGISSVYCPVIAAEARKMIREGKFKMINVADFPRSVPLCDKYKRHAYFAIDGTAAALEELMKRVQARILSAPVGQERDALLGAMTPVL